MESSVGRANPKGISLLIMSKPSVELVASYLECIAEMRIQGDRIWDAWVPKAGEGAPDFVARIVRAETSATPPWVTTTTYWATLAGAVVGRGALRHELTEDLAGHHHHLICAECGRVEDVQIGRASCRERVW